MASTTNLLYVLLLLAAITFVVKSAPNDYPGINPSFFNDSTGTSFCPPISSEDGKFHVTVSGSKSPRIGGCAWLRPIKGIFGAVIPKLVLWLGRGDTGDLRCGSPITQMDRFVFECSNDVNIGQNHSRGWYYAMLFNDQVEKDGGDEHQHCALYWVVDHNQMLIKMVISKDKWCYGLSDRMKQPSYSLPPGEREFSDGSMVLLFRKERPGNSSVFKN